MLGPCHLPGLQALLSLLLQQSFSLPPISLHSGRLRHYSLPLFLLESVIFQFLESVIFQFLESVVLQFLESVLL